MAYEIVYVEDFAQDLDKIKLGSNDSQLLHAKIEQLAESNNPALRTERLLSSPLRKLRFHDYRVFLHIDATQETIYVMDIKHHNMCYSLKNINKILTRLRDL